MKYYYFNGRPYIKVAGVDFYPEELAKNIRDGECYLLTSRGIYILSMNEAETEFSAALLAKIRFAAPGRFFLWNRKAVKTTFPELKLA